LSNDPKTPPEIRKETVSSDPKQASETQSKPPESAAVPPTTPEEKPKEEEQQQQQPAQPQTPTKDPNEGNKLVVISDPSTCPGCVRYENALNQAGIPHESVTPEQAGYHGQIPRSGIFDSSGTMVHDFGNGNIPSTSEVQGFLPSSSSGGK